MSALLLEPPTRNIIVGGNENPNKESPILPILLNKKKQKKVREWNSIYPKMELALQELVSLLGEKLSSTSLKSQGSCFEKLDRKGYSSLLQLTDLVRGEIVVGDIQEVVWNVYWLDSVLSDFDISIQKIEAKVNENYHGVVHIDLKIKGIGVELKVITKEAKEAHRITHSLYKKGKATEGIYTWEKVSNFSKEDLVAIELLK